MSRDRGLLLVSIGLVAIASQRIASAQDRIDWQRYHTANDNLTAEVGWRAAFTPGGAVYVAGRVSDATDPNVFDPLVVKYDAAGRLLWSRRDTTIAGNDGSEAIGIDAEDGVVVASSLLSGTGSDVRVRRYAADGTLSWSAPPYDFSGGEDFVAGGKCLVDAQGNVYVACISEGTSYDVVLLSYTSQGAFRWAARYDGPTGEDDFARALGFDGHGGVVVAGSSRDDQEFLVLRVDFAGTISWATPFQTSSNPHGYWGRLNAVTCDSAGRVFVAGRGPSASGDEIGGWVHMLDSTGGVLWSRYRSIEQWFDVAMSGSGVVATGVQYAPETQRDAVTERFDGLGNSRWQQTWGTSPDYNDDAQTVLVDSTGEVMVAGRNSSNYGSHLPQHFFVLRYASDGTPRGTTVIQESEASDCSYGGFAAAADGSFVLAGGRVLIDGDAVDAEIVKIRHTWDVFCAGDGFAIACPCGNGSGEVSQRGCWNSLFQSAQLLASGEPSLAADTLVLNVTGELPSALTIFLQGNAFISPRGFGDGVRCVGGSLKRLYTRTAVQGSASAPSAGEPSISARSAALGDPIAPGSARGIQVYYRDGNPQFCPPPIGSSFNASNGVRVNWFQ